MTTTSTSKTIQILHRFTMAVIFEAAVDTVKDAVLQAISQRISLTGANLTGVNLTYANLTGANLDGANLDGANLTGVNLTYANLTGVNLTYANLTYANLTGANLDGANLTGVNLTYANLTGASLTYANLTGASLTGANLTGANLTYANLTYANLTYANLDGANLTGARLPSPTVVLLAAWGPVSDQLCADLMVWDSMNHPDSTMFDKWALGGPCPYVGVKVGRAANFRESKELWGKGVIALPYQLMLRVLAEKCPEWTDEEKASFDLTMKSS